MINDLSFLKYWAKKENCFESIVETWFYWKLFVIFFMKIISIFSGFPGFWKSNGTFHDIQLSYCVKNKELKVSFLLSLPSLMALVLGLANNCSGKSVLYSYIADLVYQQNKLLWWENMMNFSSSIRTDSCNQKVITQSAQYMPGGFH